jgi:hypothetical protein
MVDLVARITSGREQAVAVSRDEVAQFYQGVAARLDALRGELSGVTKIDNKFAAFLATAAWEIRQDTDAVAAKLSDLETA